MLLNCPNRTGPSTRRSLAAYFTARTNPFSGLIDPVDHCVLGQCCKASNVIAKVRRVQMHDLHIYFRAVSYSVVSCQLQAAHQEPAITWSAASQGRLLQPCPGPSPARIHLLWMTVRSGTGQLSPPRKEYPACVLVRGSLSYQSTMALPPKPSSMDDVGPWLAAVNAVLDEDGTNSGLGRHPARFKRSPQSLRNLIVRRSALFRPEHNRKTPEREEPSWTASG